MNERGNLAPASWPGASQTVQKLEYDGRIGALYWIFIKNFLLNLITFTIYRFWGKTNLRRYAWSHTSLQGQRFEYTGTGGELFIGFLIVFAFYIIAGLGFSIGTLLMGPKIAEIGRLIFGLLILYFVFVAQYAAQNYRLTRTLWSGMRGGMTGSAWTYGVKAFLFTLLNLLTLNLATPWVTLRLAEDRFNNSYFGSSKASLEAKAGVVFPWFLLGVVLTIIGIFVYVSALGAVAYVAIEAFDLGPILEKVRQQFEMGIPGKLTPEETKTFVIFVMVSIVSIYLGFAMVAFIAFAPYVAAVFREIANNLRLAELTFSSTVTSWSYISLWIGNLLWVVLTLGFGFPVAVHRSLKFFADRVMIHGELDVERLQQGSLDRPKFGEVLLEAFDPGIL